MRVHPSFDRRTFVWAAAGCFAASAGCQDVSSYSTTNEKQYVGCVVPARFVLSGTSPTTELCLTLDASHLQVSPGAISSSDGRFRSTPLRPIPELWSDPLSTFNFGEGRTKNLLYVATPDADGGQGDVMVVVSLMAAGGVEVRLLRGAPPVGSADAGGSAKGSNLFAVFPLTLETGGCASLRASHCALDAQ